MAADLNLRNLDPKLIARLKSDAALAGKTLREWCIGLLGGNDGTGRPFEADPTGKTSRSGKPSKLPSVRNAKGSKKRLHPVQPVRPELARRGELGRESKGGAVSEDAGNHEGHRIANQGRYCLTCKCQIIAPRSSS